ncbi:MAG TPA: hypothetical protein VMU50_04385, partial [Polyangia bacterium]|nr:hypothetical protein [Polyangia bacterium]
MTPIFWSRLRASGDGPSRGPSRCVSPAASGRYRTLPIKPKPNPATLSPFQPNGHYVKGPAPYISELGHRLQGESLSRAIDETWAPFREMENPIFRAADDHSVIIRGYLNLLLLTPQ